MPDNNAERRTHRAARGMGVRAAILLLLLVSVTPLLLVQVGIYAYWLQTSQDRQIETSKELARSLAGTFDAYVRGIDQQEAAMGDEIAARWPYSEADMDVLLKANARDYPALNAFLLINPQGRTTAASDRRLIGLYVGDREYFQRAVRTREPVLSDLMEGRADANPIFVVARAIYRGDELLCVLSGSVNPDRLSDATLKIVGFREGGARFYDRSGRLVNRYPVLPMTWDQRMNAETGDLLAQALAGKEAAGIIRYPGQDRDRLAVRVPITGWGWVTGTNMPRSVILAPVWKTVSVAGVIALLAVGVSLLAAWFISRGMMRDIIDLRAHAIAVGKGQLDRVAQVQGLREITDLAAAFNEMVDARRKAEDASRQSQGHLRQLAENVREVFWLGPADGNEVIYVNPAYEQVWGKSCRSLYESPRSWLDSVIEEDKPRVIAALGDSVFGTELTVLPEYRIRRPDGTIRWIFARAWPIKDESGKTYRAAGIAEDITQRKEAEEAEAKYRSLVEESLVGVYLIQEGKFAYANPQMAAMFGYDPRELADKTVMDLVWPEDRPVVAEKLRQRIEREIRTAHYAFRAARKDGACIDVEVIGSGTIYHGRPAVIGTLQDITDRKRAEEALKIAAAELERSNRDLEQFAYVASHDLQEPLRMIAGHLGIVQSHLTDKLDADTMESMMFAVDGASRMQSLIRDLLAYSRVGRKATGFVPTDMEAVFAEASRNIAAAIGEAGAEVTHDPLPSVLAEPTQMVQLMQNLLSNAVKYRPTDRKPEIKVGAWREGKGWVLFVRDNGIGMRPEDHERIFMIFQRLHTRQEYPGTGIGLAICKKIVEYHCGRIWVESQTGQGATFYFTIPDRE